MFSNIFRQKLCSICLLYTSWNVQKDAETPLVVEFSKEELDYMRRSCEAIAEQQMPDEMWAVVAVSYTHLLKG